MARRALTAGESLDWAAYASLVAPLPGRGLPVLPPAPAPPPTLVVKVAPAPVQVVRPALPRWGRLEIGAQPAGVDNATWRRLRTGRVTADRSLDLHGYNAQRAFHALEAMLRHAQAQRARCVEVITGRGSGDGGVLRRELPLWLNLPHLRPMVLAAAHPHAGNTGATRLLLRRAIAK